MNVIAYSYTNIWKTTEPIDTILIDSRLLVKIVVYVVWWWS